MSQARIALLPDRGVVSVAGPDAAKLLQGVITNDMELLARQTAIHAGLLSPQGKILFEFFVVEAGDALLLDAAKESIGELVRRLSMYRLRAKATIADLSGSRVVAAQWNGAPAATGDATVFADPRNGRLGMRLIFPAEHARTMLETTRAAKAEAADYHAHRIALGVPEGGKDYPLGDTFPHEADFDLLDGVSFTKGCYVGQELVARMQHKAVVRKRVVRIAGKGPLSSGTEVRAGEAAIGTVGSVAGPVALALVRLDRVAEALDKGQALTAGGVAITVDGGALEAYRKAAAKAHGA
jgi:hypothetical protein